VKSAGVAQVVAGATTQKGTGMKKFKGWDYTELTKALTKLLGEKLPKRKKPEGELSIDTEYKNLEHIFQFLREAESTDFNRKFSQLSIKELDKAYAYTRAFLRALVLCCEQIAYHGPIFKGLLKIKNRETFYLYCQILAGHMWN
jgi:hypothetical protein